MPEKSSNKTHVHGWRSLLFVPANQERFIIKAQDREADAIILDLEDSVPQARKQEARSSLESAVNHLVGHGQSTCVRINATWREAIRDLEHAVMSGVKALVIPKVETPYHLQALDEVVSELEREKGLEEGTIVFIPIIETAAGLLATDEIACAGPRVAAMALGPEDLAADLGCAPTRETMTDPCRRLIYSARAAGIIALGFPDSIANFQDKDAFQNSVQKAREMGLTGAFCIHPQQVKVLNQIFQPTNEEHSWAVRIVEGYAKSIAQGEGVLSIDGKMIDAPVVQRARQILARTAIIQKPSSGNS